MIGDKIARIWTIRMNPENGEIKGYYCAFPKADETQYISVLKALADGKKSQYEQKQMRMIRDEERLQDPNTP